MDNNNNQTVDLALKSKLFKKLLNVKKQVAYLQKNTQGFNFKYANPESVLTTFNPLLNDEGLFLKTESIDVKGERVFSKKKTNDVFIGGKKESVIVDSYETLFHLTLRFTWIDTETGYEDSAIFSASGINNDEQGQGSAQTYAERYFLLKTFNVPTGNDDPDALGIKRLGSDETPKTPVATAPKTIVKPKSEVKKDTPKTSNQGIEDILTKLKAIDAVKVLTEYTKMGGKATSANEVIEKIRTKGDFKAATEFLLLF